MKEEHVEEEDMQREDKQGTTRIKKLKDGHGPGNTLIPTQWMLVVGRMVALVHVDPHVGLATLQLLHVVHEVVVVVDVHVHGLSVVVAEKCFSIHVDLRQGNGHPVVATLPLVEASQLLLRRHS